MSAATVAFAMLIGFVVPRLFASTLRTPPSSSTARTPPPAMTPVPSEAGRSITRAASKWPSTSWVIVEPCFGTVNMILLRVLDRLGDRERNLARLAVADADAVDLVADDDERREREPPAALDDLGDAVDLDHALLELACLLVIDSHQKLKSSLARAVGERLHTAVVQVPGAVEHGTRRRRPALAFFASSLPTSLACAVLSPLNDALSASHDAAAKRAAAHVVDELRGDAAVRARHDEARTLRRALHLAADAAVTALARLANGQARHACPPFYARTRPRTGCPCPCTAPAGEPCESRQPSGRPAACRCPSR